MFFCIWGFLGSLVGLGESSLGFFLLSVCLQWTGSDSTGEFTYFWSEKYLIALRHGCRTFGFFPVPFCSPGAPVVFGRGLSSFSFLWSSLWCHCSVLPFEIRSGYCSDVASIFVCFPFSSPVSCRRHITWSLSFCFDIIFINHQCVIVSYDLIRERITQEWRI